MTNRASTTGMGVLLISLLLAALPASAIPFRIDVDTRALAGTAAFLDLQLNPADAATPAALARITNFGGNITLLGPPQQEGAVTGALPSSLAIGNDAAFNNYFQSVRFGSFFSFLVDFSGDFLTQPSIAGSSFGLSLYAADGFSPLLSTDIAGTLARFEVAAAGVRFRTFPPDLLGTAPVARITPVPLSGTVWLMWAGILGFAANRKRAARTYVPAAWMKNSGKDFHRRKCAGHG